VGSALALLLAAHAPAPERIALAGHQFDAPQTPAPTSASDDPRTLALNHGSRALLRQLRAWPERHALIETVHVSQRGRLGRTLITHEDLGVSSLGSVVPYGTLVETLHHALRESGIALLPGSAKVSGHMTVVCDGARPSGVHREYGQHAVLTTVRASRPRPGWAFERFTAEGPLALLPHPSGESSYGLIWCARPHNARRLQQLGEQEFETELRRAFGDRLGRLECDQSRHIFPLTLDAGPVLIQPHTVAIGNAAQTLHPVAGQGLNLGLRDAAQLSHTMTEWLADPTDDPAPRLARYASRRRADRWLTTGLTDFLPRIFATRNALVEHACGLGLLALDLLPPLRRPLARQLLQGLR